MQQSRQVLIAMSNEAFFCGATDGIRRETLNRIIMRLCSSVLSGEQHDRKFPSDRYSACWWEWLFASHYATGLGFLPRVDVGVPAIALPA